MNLPIDFEIKTKEELGIEEYNLLEQSILSTSPTSIRVNLNKSVIDKFSESDKVPWCSTAFYLDERPSFTFDPLFHAGTYYVQEASSMFLEQGIKQFIKGDVIGLDLCAAPGGKSTLTKSLLSSSSLLVSNEYVRSRSYILSENMMKWGDPNYIVCNNKPNDFNKLTHFFDFVIIDAPCSGEGMFRKDVKAIEEWNLSNVRNCSERQKSIIKDVWDVLKPGGYLFYSTCTYNTDENESVVSFIEDLGAEVLSLEIEKKWNIVTRKIGKGEVYHFYPHKIKGEGFFFSVLQKRDEESFEKNSKQKLRNSQKILDLELSNYLKNYQEFELMKNGDNFLAIPKNMLPSYTILSQYLNIVSAGITLGQIKGRDFIPNQSLALSCHIDSSLFNLVEIDKESAISFLRCETLYLTNAPKGLVLLQYQGVNIGFVKNIGSRANNLYPNEWRIRSSY